MSPAKNALYILRYLGPRVVWLRTGVYLGKFLGRSRRTFRARPWDQIDLAEITQAGTPTDPDGYARFKRDQAPEFLFPLGQPPDVPDEIRGAAAERQPPLAERLKLLAEDRCVYFFRSPSPMPIDWYANPFDETRSQPGQVWSDIPDYLPEQGDPRMLWEPGRAAWAIDLARARSHGQGIHAAGLFWRWVDSWMTACPPWEGFQWKCGQESAVRFIAVALGFWSLADDPATTPERWRQFARLAWATGYRIAHHINYAISQKNNHAMSEACGLLLISHLFPEFRDAAAWWDKGYRVLAQEIRRQTCDDGSYVQNAMNYQRVMLAGSTLGLRLAELRGQPFDRDVYERLGRCGEFLFQMMEPQTGRLPQYGNNDGAHVLPLNECDFTDFRPVIQATHYLVHRERRLPAGAWDEDLLWLFGADALRAPAGSAPRPQSTACEVGGYYTLRQANTWAMLRCHTHRDRPAHYDQLHLDLWYRGQNVVQDCGTYKYYIPGRPDIERYFKSIAAHNTVEIDGASPVEFVSRFLWFPWPRGRSRRFESDADGHKFFVGEHYDYDRPPWNVLHRRTVLSLPHDIWLVVDDLLGTGEHAAVLRWHLLDVPHEFDASAPAVTLHTASGDFCVSVSAGARDPDRAEIIRGRDEPERVQGFAAPYYGERLPIPTLEVSYRSQSPLRVLTTLSPETVILPRLVDESPARQCWEVGSPAASSIIELGPPARNGATLIGINAGDTQQTT